MSSQPDLSGLRIERTARGRRPARRGWIVWTVLLVAVAAVVFALLHLRGRPVDVVVGEVRAVPATEVDRPVPALNGTGYVTARVRATVSSKITGRLVDVRVEEGLPVARGDVLARLEDREARAALALADARVAEAERAVAQTDAEIRLAEITLGRTTSLVEGGVVGEADLDRDRTALETLVARREVEVGTIAVARRARDARAVELDDTVIRAPFSGIVISKDAQAGEMVSPVSAGGGFTRTGICTVVDMSSLEIEVDVNEAYLARVFPEQRVEATLEAYPDAPIPGSVITTIPAADRQKATVRVRIRFDEIDDRVLPDMSVRVAFLTAPGAGEVEAPAAIVPREAIRRVENADVVLVVPSGGEGELEVREVARVRDDALGVAVTGDIRPGESVVVEGPEDLAEGRAVRARPRADGGGEGPG